MQQSLGSRSKWTYLRRGVLKVCIVLGPEFAFTNTGSFRVFTSVLSWWVKRALCSETVGSPIPAFSRTVLTFPSVRSVRWWDNVSCSQARHVERHVDRTYMEQRRHSDMGCSSHCRKCALVYSLTCRGSNLLKARGHVIASSSLCWGRSEVSSTHQISRSRPDSLAWPHSPSVKWLSHQPCYRSIDAYWEHISAKLQRTCKIYLLTP